MICSMFKSAARDHVAFVAVKDHPADIADLADKYIAAVGDITREYRALRSMLNVPVITPEHFQPYALGDEYLSLLIEWFAYQLLETLKGKADEVISTLKSRILEVVRKEHHYRQQRNYPSIPKADDANEKFVFRSSILKKYMSSVLFLNTRVRREGGLVEHIAFGLAAGIAVALATWASLWLKSAYSQVSIPLFLLLVLSYVFKDRIKEVCRIYFGNLLRRWLFDHKLTILHTQERIGWCKESVTLLPDNKVPARIRRLRNRGHLTEIESDWLGEQAILYRKRIKLFSRTLNQIYADYPLTGINDIIRFNVLKFLNKMDNPFKILYILSGKDYRSIQAKRTYHITLIITYKYKGFTTFKRFRIVLCRNGIERIDEIYKDEIKES